jgi:serine/threonine-protein kinase
MAPEQLAGEAIDHRADLWSLGVVLYEAISGRLPISGEGLAHRILTKDPVPLAAARPDVPRPLARLVMRLLKKDPAMRVQSAAEVERVLREWAEGRTSGASAPLSGSRPKMIAGAALAALGVAGTLGFVRSVSEPTREPFASAREQDTDVPGDKLDPGVHVTTVRPSSLFEPSTSAPTTAPAGNPAGPPTRAVVANPTAQVHAKRLIRENEGTLAARSAAARSTVAAPAPSGASAPSARASFDGLGLPEKPF